METLVIYDNNGTIFFQASGEIIEPVGIPFLWVDIPPGMSIKNIDTSTNPNMPIFEEVKKSKIERDIESIKLLVADLGLQIGGNL